MMDELLTTEVMIIVGIVAVLCCSVILFCCYRERAKQKMMEKQLEMEKIRAGVTLNHHAETSQMVVMTPSSMMSQSADGERVSGFKAHPPIKPLPDALLRAKSDSSDSPQNGSSAGSA